MLLWNRQISHELIELPIILLRQPVVVVIAWKDEQCLRLVGGGVQSAAKPDRNCAVVRAVDLQ